MASAEFDTGWESALNAAFEECEALGYGLTAEQQAILRRAIARSPGSFSAEATANPLEELAPDQRQAFLQYIDEQDRQNLPWKAQFLNDWLQGTASGEVQFVRDDFGLAWLERITPEHLAQYRQSDQLRVGDRIEIASNLWEWTQEDGPCPREWFPCTVINLTEPGSQVDGESIFSGTVRFDNGMEYEIQGIYDWNRYNWRWLGES
ncbi:hypothetical protein IQ267_08910 [filamentous cyanobacterium LEGE 07170]|nr:hypothetical protein [filamentous cyanobacterium LEGE 07170]